MAAIIIRYSVSVCFFYYHGLLSHHTRSTLDGPIRPSDINQSWILVYDKPVPFDDIGVRGNFAETTARRQYFINFSLSCIPLGGGLIMLDNCEGKEFGLMSCITSFPVDF